MTNIIMLSINLKALVEHGVQQHRRERDAEIRCVLPAGVGHRLHQQGYSQEGKGRCPIMLHPAHSLTLRSGCAGYVQFRVHPPRAGTATGVIGFLRVVHAGVCAGILERVPLPTPAVLEPA